jgi:hypothetical protein
MYNPRDPTYLLITEQKCVEAFQKKGEEKGNENSETLRNGNLKTNKSPQEDTVHPKIRISRNRGAPRRLQKQKRIRRKQEWIDKIDARERNWFFNIDHFEAWRRPRSFTTGTSSEVLMPTISGKELKRTLEASMDALRCHHIL